MCKSDESRIVSVGYRGRCEYVVRYRGDGNERREERPKGGKGVKRACLAKRRESRRSMKKLLVKRW